MLEIRVLQDRERWNALLAGFPAADLRQSHEWGEIRRRQGWTPLRLAALEGGRGVAALSVLTRRLPGIGVVAYAPRGPALAPDDERGWEALSALADTVRDVTGAVFLRLSPGLPSEHSNLRQRLATAGFVELCDFWPLWNTPRNVMRMSVTAPEREILARMAPKRRQHITSTAVKKGVTTEVVADLPALHELYTMLRVHGARHGYPIRDWSYFEALHAAFAPTGALGMVAGRVNGTLASALIGVRFG